MRRVKPPGASRLGMRLALVLAVAIASAPRPAAGAPKGPAAPAFTSVALVIRHRVFPNFIDRQEVKLNKDFIVGDTDYSAQVVRYVPDFFMNVKTRTIGSRSNEPKNPAFQIIVRENKVPQDTTWAFLKSPPHFARNSMLAFQVQRIDFPDRPPIVQADSTAHAPPASESRAPGAPTGSGSPAAHPAPPAATHPPGTGLTTQPSHPATPGMPPH